MYVPCNVGGSAFRLNALGNRLRWRWHARDARVARKDHLAGVALWVKEVSGRVRGYGYPRKCVQGEEALSRRCGALAGPVAASLFISVTATCTGGLAASYGHSFSCLVAVRVYTLYHAPARLLEVCYYAHIAVA